MGKERITQVAGGYRDGWKHWPVRVLGRIRRNQTGELATSASFSSERMSFKLDYSTITIALLLNFTQRFVRQKNNSTFIINYTCHNEQTVY